MASSAELAPSAEPLKIRGAWVAPVANWVSIWLQKKDLAVHFGQSYVFEPVRYAGTPPMITAIANNELEIGNLAFSTLPIAIENAGMDDIRVIADEFQDGVAGYYRNEFMVLTDGPIKKIEDLKGKVVATNAAGSGVDVAMRAMLRKHGLEANRDYTIIEAPFPAMKAMLAEKKVDLIPAVLPFALDPELKKIARSLFDMQGRDRRHRSSSCGRRASRSSTRIAPRWSTFSKTRCASCTGISIRRTTMRPPQIASQLTKQPPERFGWVFTKKDYYRDPDLMPDLDALQRNVDMTHDLGFVKASFDVKAHSDLSHDPGGGKAAEVICSGCARRMPRATMLAFSSRARC